MSHRHRDIIRWLTFLRQTVARYSKMNLIYFPVNTVKASITSFFLFKLETAENTFH